MLVQCPNCKTNFRVSDDVIKGTSPVFRCSRCRHTFEIRVSSQQPAEDPKLEETPNRQTSEELSFPFAVSKPPAPAVPPQGSIASSESTSAEKIAEPGSQSGQGPWTFGEARNKEDHGFTMPEPNPTPRTESTAQGGDSASAVDAYFGPDPGEKDSDGIGHILAMDSYVEQRASIFPYLTLFALLAIVFSLVAAISRAHPRFPESLVKQIPLLGTVILRNNHLKNGILIRSMRTSHQTIQGDREVFIVTGEALNQNPVVIREVRVTGTVYDPAGEELEQQTIWLGNTISPKIIRGMTPEDIPHLQNLKPLRSFEIPPGDSVPFTIVFLKSAKSANAFTCQVVSAAAEI
jgi:predicted Zn finger-like uncharacterized protein